MSFLSRALIEVSDSLFYSRRLRAILAEFLRLATPAVSGKSETRRIAGSIVRLCSVARAQRGERRRKTEAEIARRVALTLGRQIDWAMVSPWKTDQIEKAIVLKPCVSSREKGVVYVPFQCFWLRLMCLKDLEEFARRYTLIIGPSSGPPHCVGTTLFCAHYPAGRIFSFITDPEDFDILPRLSPKLCPLPLYPSNWVNPDLYCPVPFDRKDIDIVMVAGFGRVKRHFTLFRALRDMPRDLRIVLIGSPMDGRSAADVLREARDYGVLGRFELKDTLPHGECIQHLARAKISLMLSFHEGANVAVVESMFADTPVAIYEDARNGSRQFINEQTGRFLRHTPLAPQLLDFLAGARKYSPRRWALENGISCHGSTQVLNRSLREAALASGEEWTQDIALHQRRIEPVLVRPEDLERLRPEYQEIRRRHGMAFGMAKHGVG